MPYTAFSKRFQRKIGLSLEISKSINGSLNDMIIFLCVHELLGVAGTMKACELNRQVFWTNRTNCSVFDCASISFRLYLCAIKCGPVGIQTARSTIIRYYSCRRTFKIHVYVQTPELIRKGKKPSMNYTLYVST